jgi:hypothetical protein
MLLKKTVTELARDFSHFVNRVAYKHNSIILLRGKKEVAELRPIVSGLPISDFANLMDSLPHLSEPELEAFSTDLKVVRDSMNDEPVRDPWAS